MRIVLDTTILVRANIKSHGLARNLLLDILSGGHRLIISDEMLYELSRVLRYPRLQRVFQLLEADVYEYIGLLRNVAEVVRLSAIVNAPIRDVNDLIVIQTALEGEAKILCTTDPDFFDPRVERFLQKCDIELLTDVELMRRVRLS